MGNYQKTLLLHVDPDDLTGGSNAAQFVTGKSGDSLTQNVPLLYDSNGNVVSTATRTGNTTLYATHDAGGYTSGNLVAYDANGNLTDSGGTGGGGASNKFGWLSITNPPTSGWTALNSTSVSTDNDSRIIACPASASTNLRPEVRSLSGTITIEAGFSRLAAGLANYNGVGMVLRESGTGKMVTLQYRNDGIITEEQFSGFTAFVTAYTLDRAMFPGDVRAFGMRLTYGPTNRVWEFSLGSYWLTLHTIAKDDYATTAFDQYGWFVQSSNSQVIDGELFHWAES